jgi:hypothetical protein
MAYDVTHMAKMHRKNDHRGTDDDSKHFRRDDHPGFRTEIALWRIGKTIRLSREATRNILLGIVVSMSRTAARVAADVLRDAVEKRRHTFRGCRPTGS